jgi:hypothetical protein
MPAHINYIRHVNTFFAQARQDKRLHANHVSLYMSLFHVWNQHRFQNPFPILREEVVSFCHIGSPNTYTQCLKDLAAFGYILYQKGGLRGASSQISFLQLGDNQAEMPPVQLCLFSNPFLETFFPSFKHAIIGTPISCGSKKETVISRKIDTGNLKNDTVIDRKIDTAGRKTDTATSLRIDTRCLKNDTTSRRKIDTVSVAKLRQLYKHINNNKLERVNRRSRKKKLKNHVPKNHPNEPAVSPLPGPAAPPAGPPPVLD